MGLPLILFSLIIFFSIISAVNSCPPADRAALLDFKAALDEPYLGLLDSWAGKDCCHNWYGVSCDPTTGRVADISLRGESEDPIFEKAGRTGFMTGSLSPSLCQLDRLSTLVVADWKGISCNIPSCVTSLPNLRILDLVGNQISGAIPVDIGGLSRLAVLNLADNLLSGPIPASIVNLQILMHLDLSNNRISGAIPADLGKLTNDEPSLTESKPTQRVNPEFSRQHSPTCRFRSIHEPDLRSNPGPTWLNAGSLNPEVG